MDTRLYLDLNRFARSTVWAHGFMRAYALYLGLVLLGAAALLAYGQARSSWLGDGSSRRVAATLWTPLAALVAFGISQPVSHAIGRLRPYEVLAHVEVLVPRAHDFTFPSDHATVAGAVAAGLWISRRRLLAVVGTVLGLLLAFARVYVGAHYVGDVLGGLALGAVVATAGYPLAVPLLERLVDGLRATPLRFLAGGHRPSRPSGAGPAAVPETIRATGSVRVLEGGDVVVRRPASSGLPSDGARREARSS